MILGDSFLGSKYLDPGYLFNHGVDFLHHIFNFSSVSGLNNIFSLFSLFFLSLIFYCAVRLFEIRAKERKHLQEEIAEYAHHQAEQERKKQEGEGVSKNARWVQVLTFLSSVNSADWRLAIIEADSMLEGLLDQLGFK